MFKNTNSVNCAKIVFSQSCWDVKKEVFEKNIAFFVSVFLMLLKEKQKNGKKAQKLIKIVFLRWLSKNEKHDKNGFLAKISLHHLCQEGRENAHFRAHYLFWPKNALVQSSQNQEKKTK